MSALKCYNLWNLLKALSFKYVDYKHPSGLSGLRRKALKCILILNE